MRVSSSASFGSEGVATVSEAGGASSCAPDLGQRHASNRFDCFTSSTAAAMALSLALAAEGSVSSVM
jgi:hypothetical protein